MCSGDRNVSKHAIISRNVVPYVAAEASQEKYGYLRDGNMQLFCFHGGEMLQQNMCSLCEIHSGAELLTHARQERRVGSNGACTHVCLKGEKELSPEV